MAADAFVIQEEQFSKIAAEICALAQENHRESPIALPGIELDLNVDAYLSLERLGALHILTVRKDDVLVGYHSTIVRTHPHFQSILAGVSDAYYLKPEFRGAGLGAALMKATRTMWKKYGARIGTIGTRNANSYGKMFENMGWTPNEQTYVIDLEA